MADKVYIQIEKDYAEVMVRAMQDVIDRLNLQGTQEIQYAITYLNERLKSQLPDPIIAEAE